MKFWTMIALVALVALALAFGSVMAKKSDRDGSWMGIFIESVDYDLIEELELPIKYGVHIVGLTDDSPAEAAGMEKGDVIISVDKMKITDIADLRDALSQFDEGDKVDVVVLRDGKEKTVNVELEEMPERKVLRYNRRVPHAYTRHLSYPSSDRGYLGVSLEDLNRQLGKFFGVEKGRGALIEEVVEDTPAEEAGLLAGDVIVKVDGYQVADVDDVSDEIGDHEAGDKVELTIIRDKKEMTVSVELDEHRNTYYVDDFDFDFDFDDAQGHYFDAMHNLDLSGLKELKALKALEALEAWDVPDAPDAPGEDYYIWTNHGKKPRIINEWDEDEREEYEAQMKGLKEEMKKLKQELKHLKDKLD